MVTKIHKLSVPKNQFNTLIFAKNSKEMAAEDQEVFYARLKKQLKETSQWPSDYLFKFIALTGSENIPSIHRVFDNLGAVITSKKSKNGKYTSVSITVNLKSPDAVVKKYQEVGVLEGVIAL